MLTLIVTNGALGVLPALAFLATLAHFDSFRLVRAQTIFRIIGAGAFAAVVGYLVNTNLMRALSVDFAYYIHFVAPVIEEGLKALIIIALLRANHIGFAFDAVILGFAAGAGFALVENFYYLKILGVDHPAIWMIRGFGTAIMHGGTTAIFAMASHLLTLRETRFSPLYFLPGFIVAITLHAGFNFFLDYPVSSTIAMMAMLASVLSLSLGRDTKSIHDWVVEDFERRRKLLAAIKAGRYEEFRLGRLLRAMHARMGDEVAENIVEYIRTHTELVIAAERELLAREKGEKPEIDERIREKLQKLHALEKQIGKTGCMVMRAHLHISRHELFEIYMLEKEAGAASAMPHGAAR